MNELATKFQELRSQLEARLIERDAIIEGGLVALLSRQHIFFLGPPGTAKSLAAELICSGVGGTYFEWLMDKFCKPEDLFGMHDLPQMKEGKYVRNTTYRLPEATVAFLDEIWKASGTSLTFLNRILDDSRRFYNPQASRTPLISCFTASNEIPHYNGSGADRELEALYDRLTLRYVVNRISDLENFKKVMRLRTSMTNAFQGIEPVLTLEELQQAHTLVDAVEYPEAMLQIQCQIRTKLAQIGKEYSERRWGQLIKVLQGRAFLYGRSAVEVEDFDILAYGLWNEPDEFNDVRKAILEFTSPNLVEALNLLDKATEIYENAMNSAANSNATAVGIEANQKFKAILVEFDRLPHKSDPKVDEIGKRISEQQVEVARRCMGFRV